MATFTANTAMPVPASGDSPWATYYQTAFAMIDAFTPVGALAVSLHETPSTSLNVAVAAGVFENRAGAKVTYGGASSHAMTASTTNYVYLTDGGTLTVNTTGFPSTGTYHVPLATVVAGSSSITSIVDSRVAFGSVGGTNGTFVGTLIVQSGGGTSALTVNASTPAIGFFNATPVGQQTGGAATAGGTWTSTEQGMLNKSYSALRALGLIT